MPILVLLGVAFVFAIMSLFGSFISVDEGERAVITRFGAIESVQGPGLGFKTPWVTSATVVDVKQQLGRWPGLPTYSTDQQSADLTVSVNWSPDAGRVEEIYRDYGGYLEVLSARALEPNVIKAVKDTFGQYTAARAISDRAGLTTRIQQALEAMVAEENYPLRIHSVQLENVDFSDAYEASVEKRMLAEVEVAQLRQNAEREKVSAEITVTKADADAKGVKLRADADAYARRAMAEAEADGIAKRGKALADNPLLVQLTKAERWNGVLPTTVLPDGAIPFVEAN